MKYIAFILLGLVLLAAIGVIVLWANMPTAKLRVHAVRPMGTNFVFFPPRGEPRISPVWEIAITNNGRAQATWVTDAVMLAEHGRLNFPIGTYVQVFGHLNPGCSTNVYMAFAPPSNSVWAVAVQYFSPPRPLERKAYSLLKPLPRLRRSLPNFPRFAYDAWHSGTNVITASDPAPTGRRKP